MDFPEPWVTAAGIEKQLRPMTEAETAALAEHTRAGRAANGDFVAIPSFPVMVVDGQVLEGQEHGSRDGGTLCGISAADVFLMRHPFFGSRASDCPECARILHS